jgi:hypothetical protein
VEGLRDLHLGDLVADPRIDRHLADFVRPRDRHVRPTVDQESLGAGLMSRRQRGQGDQDQARTIT